MSRNSKFAFEVYDRLVSNWSYVFRCLQNIDLCLASSIETWMLDIEENKVLIKAMYILVLSLWIFFWQVQTEMTFDINKLSIFFCEMLWNLGIKSLSLDSVDSVWFILLDFSHSVIKPEITLMFRSSRFQNTSFAKNFKAICNLSCWWSN